MKIQLNSKLAYDIIKKEKIAIKLIKNKDAFYNQAQIEIDILNQLHSKKYCSNLSKEIQLNFFK
jgi:hypothetical protein